MEISEELFLNDNQLITKLEPKLKSLPFHVTTPENYEKIIASGFIQNNQKELFPFQFGQSRNSYFKNMGCVSICDFKGLESLTENERSLYKSKYPYLNPTKSNQVIHILLKESVRQNLISWKGWKTCNDVTQSIVAHFEFGFPERLPTDLFQKVIKTNIVKT